MRAPSANKAALKAHFLPFPILSSSDSHGCFAGVEKKKIKMGF